ncbi:autophagy-related protein 13 homolog isoform X2 [Battus philenor]|uniref:autophagy-related protein 13 homolog isoform X2 n=1 Tax=Battus philenor TaxID=42288 RepID=UPI0035CEBBA8
MTALNLDTQDRFKLHKFTKILTLKVAQIVVQSRQGKKITPDYIASKPEEPPSSTSLQWFNLSIPDEPSVNTDAKRVLNGEILEALAKVLCIEISLRTSDGDEMVLEVWTVKLLPGCDASITSVSAVYYRMSIMLKSTLSISRITPAYKLSRSQFKESYKISHKIYGGQPNLEILGENPKTVKVSELHTPIGTILIEVIYRTKMTMLPEDRGCLIEANSNNSHANIMMKSDHFPTENRTEKRNFIEKKECDLSKPLTAGAFVDVEKIKELQDTLYQQLPPEPPLAWLLAEKDKMEAKMKLMAISDAMKQNIPGSSTETPAYVSASNAIEVPKCKDNRFCSLIEFPFADGSPIAELADFYQECLQARSTSREWTDGLTEVSVSTASESLEQQLAMFEEAVPEFDSLVASMLSNSDNESDH